MGSDKQKILLITVRSDFGGGPMHVDLLQKNLSPDFEFFIAAPLNEPFGYSWKSQVGADRFFELPFRSFSIVKFVKLIFFIKYNSICIIHSHGKGAGIYSRLIHIFLWKIKVIHTFHGIHIQQYNFINKNLYILLERFLCFFTDLFINVSFGEQNICLQNRILSKNKSRIIYNAINPIISYKYTRNELRQKLSLPLEKFLIISVLRFNYQKNIPLLLNIAEQLNRDKRYIFLIIGDGEQREQVELEISSKGISNIKLLGFRTDVIEYLQASDIFLSTSLWEGLPYTLIEATACGLPIIASNVMGNNEVVIDGENGYLFNLENPSVAINKILYLADFPDQLKMMGEHSLKIFNEKFQLDTMVAQMKEIYKNFYISK